MRWRWPWTRDDQTKKEDEIRAGAAAINLDAAVARANRVLDRADQVMNKVERRLGTTNGGNGD